MQKFSDKIILVTYFDSNYLFFGKTLIESLKRFGIDVIIYCLDDFSYSVVKNWEGVTARNLSIDSPQIMELKKTREFRSWVWMLSSVIVELTIEKFPNYEMIVYCDSDLFFYRNPLPVLLNFNESSKDVMVSPHHYDSGTDGYLTSGAYCVQFMGFKPNSIDIVKEWKLNCLNNSGYIPGSVFGDQYYVNDWNNHYPGRVYIQDYEFSILAPWNAKTITISNAIAIHMHGIRVIRVLKSSYYLVTFGVYDFPNDSKELIRLNVMPVLLQNMLDYKKSYKNGSDIKLRFLGRYFLVKW